MKAMTYIFRAWSALAGSWGRLTGRFPWLARKGVLIPLALVFLGGAGYTAFSQPVEPEFDTGTVERQDVVAMVSETGTVQPAREVELSFTGTGRIRSVSVTEGETVREGELIATLESARQYADLLAARARLTQARESAQGSGRSLEEVEEQQDQLVENARRALLANDPQAYLVAGGSEGASRDFTAPTVTGTYTCNQEGEYRIDLYPSAAQSGGSFRYSGLESGLASVSTVQSVPLGSCGLYITFPEDFARSRSVVWEIPVPNTRSSTYQTYLNAYQAAIKNRTLALEEAERSPVLSAQIAEAQAGVAAAEAAFADTRLIAPFAGLVTDVQAVRGDIASLGTPAVSLISSEAFEIVVLIPEDDIGEVDVGDEAVVTFDAYDDMEMSARVSFISPRAIVESGAAQFEVTLQFTEADERIRAGLSVDIDIIAAEAKDVLAIPTRAVLTEDGARYVRVLATDTSFRRVPVTTGLSGEGMIEILSGLAEGDRVITFANDEALDLLTEEE